MLLDNLTDPYNYIESFLYDAIIADTVASYLRTFDEVFVKQIPRGGKVLDVGCGGAQIASSLLDYRKDIKLTGIDLSGQQIKRAEKRTKRYSDRTNFMQGSALELPFKDETFDVVYSVASIKHWPDALKGLRECSRVLKQGGRLLIVEADRGCTWRSAKKFVNDWKIPSVLKPLALMLFRSLVAGRSYDIQDVHELVNPLEFTNYEVTRLYMVPAWLLNIWK